MDTEQYLEVFLDESREHLQAINDNLLNLEKEPKDFTIVNEIFRSAHTLKGMSATMGFEDIATLTHKMENILDQILNEKFAVTSSIVDIIFSSVESLEEMINVISEGGHGKQDVTNLVHKIDQIEKGNYVAEESTQTANQVQFIALDEYQTVVVTQAKNQGYNAIYITVKVNEDCVLKGARAYMVMERLEGLGEIIQTLPSVEELEEGYFEQEFSLAFLTKETQEYIKSVIEKVSEVQSVNISDILHSTKMTTDQDLSKEKSILSTDQSKTSHEKHTQKSKTIRVNLDRIDLLMNLFEEIVIDRSRIDDISNNLNSDELKTVVENMSRITIDMQGLMLSMRMLPIEQVFNRFPRMVRGLARDLGKKIDLQLSGQDTELDRMVIDEISDPLVHLIRNSVDHGIEIPSERLNTGKPEIGTVELRAYHSGNHVFIEIEDDGAGINRKKVESKAIEKGLILAEHAEKMTNEEVYQLIFSSGFSTAEKISDVSGRGVGLDVVKSKIESLGGTIFIESEQGKGSKFSIELPLTLSILSALLVQVQQEFYAIPLSSIVETVSLPKGSMMSVHGQTVMDFRGKVIPIVALSKIFQVPEVTQDNNQNYSVVVVQKGKTLTGLLVDALVGQKEVVLKSLGNYMKDVFGISGATILGDGSVSLIVDPSALIKG
jgi:two-component system, chemotaxis family, sensor kinase CheA